VTIAALLVVLVEEMPEVKNAVKAAKYAWESAPLEQKALWQHDRVALMCIGFSKETQLVPRGERLLLSG
jgi:hypothetical protein